LLARVATRTGKLRPPDRPATFSNSFLGELLLMIPLQDECTHE